MPINPAKTAPGVPAEETTHENPWDKPRLLALAPMEGVTDRVFRAVVARSCEIAAEKTGRPQEKPLFFTEFTNVSSYASEKGRKNALERLEVAPSDTPIIAQIWGKNPDHFSEVASALSSLGFSGIDLNMGCPDRHVNSAGGGAAMILTPDLAVECINRAHQSSDLPLSVKTRLGYTSLDEREAWLTTLLSQHLSALTVHLRTRKEMSKVPAHFELIPEIITLRNQISPETKLLINGDVKDRTHAEQLLDTYPDLDGIMIGRGVFENPFCFTTYTPTQEDLKDLFLYHLDQFDAHSHEPFVTLRHFFKVYFHGAKNDKQFRAELMDCATIDELRAKITKERFL